MTKKQEDGSACCGLATKLGPEKLAELDEELSRPNHLGFKKLAAVYGTNHMAVKRHKHGCLGLTLRAEGEHGEQVGTDGHGAESDVPGKGETPPPVPPGELAPRVTRAREPREPHGSHEDCVLAIVARIAEGLLVPSDVPTWAAAWGRGESTVRAMVREAYLHARIDRGSLEERRTLAMGMWETQIKLCDEALSPPVESGKKRRGLSAMDRAMLLRERREAIAGWCKAAGVFDDSKLTINLAVNPVFVSASAAIFAALAAFPEAAAAARKALVDRLNVLKQASSGLPILQTIQTTGETVG